MLSAFVADLQQPSDERPISLVDLGLGGALVVVAVMSGFYVDAGRPDTIEPHRWWHWALMVVPPTLVVVRRYRPAAIAAVAAVAQALIWVTGLPDVLLPMLVLLYSASSDGDDRGVLVSIAITIALTVVTSIGVLVTDDVTPYLIPLAAISFLTAIVLGVGAARQRRLAGELATAVAEARLRGEHDRAAAIADERTHIARELHDVIGHTLSVIAVRAEAADRVGGENPEATRDAIHAIATSARSALTDTRRVLAGLRASAELELAPPPDLEAIRQLVQDLADAGIDATITCTGTEDHPPSAVVAGGAYRIVQESLTNAVKHGPPNVHIAVAVDCGPSRLDLQIENTVRTGPGEVEPSSDGIGLAGMAERAEVLGGTLDAGRLHGRFVVRAVLPTDGAMSSHRVPPTDSVPTR